MVRKVVPGTVHKDTFSNHLVQIISVRKNTNTMQELGVVRCMVEDLKTGRQYETPASALSVRTWNAMEVIAWAAA